MEQKEIIEDPLLKRFLSIKIPVEAFQNFDEEQAVNIIANTFHDSAAYAYTANFKPTFHPLDQVIKLHEEKIAFVN